MPALLANTLHVPCDSRHDMAMHEFTLCFVSMLMLGYDCPLKSSWGGKTVANLLLSFADQSDSPANLNQAMTLPC